MEIDFGENDGANRFPTGNRTDVFTAHAHRKAVKHGQKVSQMNNSEYSSQKVSNRNLMIMVIEE